MTDTLIVLGVVCLAGAAACYRLRDRLTPARTTPPGRPAAPRPAEVPAWPTGRRDALAPHGAAGRLLGRDPDADPRPGRRAEAWGPKGGPRPAGKDARP